LAWETLITATTKTWRRSTLKERILNQNSKIETLTSRLASRERLRTTLLWMAHETQ
jgi:hypothetical protein